MKTMKVIKVLSFTYKLILYAVCALVPIGFAFEIWDWIMGK
jgi:hypothetical protein